MPATKSISTQQNGGPITGSTLLEISSQPCKIGNVEGYCYGSAGSQLFLQLLGTATPSSGVTIPLWSRQIATANGFSFTYSDFAIDTAQLQAGYNYAGGAITGSNTLPVYLAISSSNETWTSVATNVDAEVDIELFTIEPNGATVTTTNSASAVTVWADPDSTQAHRLNYFSATNNTGAAGFVTLFALSSFNNGYYPVRTWPVASGATISEYFGREGIEVSSQDANGTNHNGCYLVGSSTVPTVTLTAANWNFTTWNI
jgi:hypothetical protein